MNKKVKKKCEPIIKMSYRGYKGRESMTNGGAMGDRTPDLLIANETLYQLSYDPICGRFVQ